MLALRRGSADDKSIATSPPWRNPGFAFPRSTGRCELRAGPL